MRYWLKFTYPQETDPAWYDSLSEVFLQLEEGTERFCHIESEDGKDRFVGTEARIRGEIAWRLLEIDPDTTIPYLKKLRGDKGEKRD